MNEDSHHGPDIPGKGSNWIPTHFMSSPNRVPSSASKVDIGHEIHRPTPRRVDGAGSSLTRLSLTPSSASSSIHIENEYQEPASLRASYEPANQSPVIRSRDPASTNQSPASEGAGSRHNTPGPAGNRLGSPFWTGLSSRDPQSRMFEFPERDVQPASSNNSLNHITNLMIDKSSAEPSSTNGYNLHLPVPAQSFSPGAEDSPALEREDQDGLSEAGHPALRQARSSFIKYNSSINKLKPKRKGANHGNKSKVDKFRSHDHIKPADDSDNEALFDRKKGNIVRGSKLVANTLEKANQLMEVKAALEQLKVETSLHSSADTYSSLSDDSEAESGLTLGERPGEREGHGGFSRTARGASHETLSTTVTSADEFVWIDSHNRLVEVQHLPWSNEDLLRLIRGGTLKESASRISIEVISRISFYMQRVLVRIAREAQRLSHKVFKCSKHEIILALKLILSPRSADNAVKSCLRAGAMYNISSDQWRQTKSSRAGLFLDIGKVQQWMCTVKIGKYVQEYSAVYLTAALETILEEVLGQCLQLTSEVTIGTLEQTMASSSELWGVFQPYAHLSSCRTSKGTLTVPKFIAQGAGGGDSVTITGIDPAHAKHLEKSMTQVLLTTCVGSKEELEVLVTGASQYYKKNYQDSGQRVSASWTRESLHTLYYFMRCSQLENTGLDTASPIQELVYERPYMVLPPLIEWLRVAGVFCESRMSKLIDQDDVFQAARILLPGADFPPRSQSFCSQDALWTELSSNVTEVTETLNRRAAFSMILSGKREFISQALQILPSTKLNTANEQGLTVLMVACLREDIGVVRLLLDVNSAGVNFKNKGPTAQCKQANSEQQNWCALHYATVTGNYDIIRLLLEKGASVEGGVDMEDEEAQSTETPLQLAAAGGRVEIVELLLSFGASPFLSTLRVDSMSFGSAAQRGCYCALSTAASHGQRKVLHKLITHPTTLSSQNSGKEVLSLEEILAEGVAGRSNDGMDEKPRSRHENAYSKFSKNNVKKLQESMYQSTENQNLDITLDLRSFGVPWTLHSWIKTLLTAHNAGLSSVIDELLQDFLREWTEDTSSYFSDECLPILFSIFRNHKAEGTILFLADVISASFGKEPIEKITLVKSDTLRSSGAPRIDPKFVNNYELSDIQFRVEGRIYYAHKLVLITSSSKFRSMLNSKFCEGSPPVLQINDIRYEIFDTVMKYLYKGSTDELCIDSSDILELMAAANFFQLDGLLHYCEIRCAELINPETIVSYYIHAKVYSAKHLLVFCEGFILQNLVDLLTFDDSIKRLIFGKKFQNHDVITGLQRTLQDRIKQKVKKKKLSQ